MENSIEMNLEQLVERYDALKKHDALDLSADQDLTIAIMNLISIEEHLFFSGAKTENSAYFSLLQEVRTMRKQLLRQIITDPHGEEWCIAKHFLAASYRLMEVGTKRLGGNDLAAAQEFFQQAYHLYSLFWGVAFKIIPETARTNESVETVSLSQNSPLASSPSSTPLMKRLGSMVKKLINCCIE